MITKSMWEEFLFVLKWQKEHYNEFIQDKDVMLYFLLCLLPILSVISILLDLLLLPFEIGYYFFKKWIRSDIK